MCTRLMGRLLTSPTCLISKRPKLAHATPIHARAHADGRTNVKREEGKENQWKTGGARSAGQRDNHKEASIET